MGRTLARTAFDTPRCAVHRHSRACSSSRRAKSIFLKNRINRAAYRWTATHPAEVKIEAVNCPGENRRLPRTLEKTRPEAPALPPRNPSANYPFWPEKKRRNLAGRDL